MNPFVDRIIPTRFFAAVLGIGLCLGNASNLLFAQQEEPAADKPAAEKPTDAEKPKPSAPKAADKAAAAPVIKPNVPSDPAVAALLAANPTTPSECAKTAKILADLDKPELAREFLKKVSDANLDRAQLAALGRELGSVTFLGFSQKAALQPEGKQLGDAVLDAMNAQYQDPQKIAAALKQLQDPSVEKRTEALQNLQNAGNAGIAALIEVLADPKREAEFKYVRAALAKMGRSASEALVSILAKLTVPSENEFKKQIILALGDAKAEDATLFLLLPYYKANTSLKEAGDDDLQKAAEYALRRIIGTVPAKQDAVKLLIDAAKNAYDHRLNRPASQDGKLEVWRWDPDKRKCDTTKLSADTVDLYNASLFALNAATIDPDNSEIRPLLWAAQIESCAHILMDVKDKSSINDEDQNLLMTPLNTKEAEDTLVYALKTKHYLAASVAAAILGKDGSADELLYPANGQSILVKAAGQPDRRLRMAALQAIAKLKPERSYPGSSNVLDALAFFASGTGTRRALVAGPNLSKLPKLVPALAAAGFKVETVNTGKEVLQKLLGSPDYEVAMIDAGISNPPIELLVQQIRRDDRSADVRVGIIARADFFEKAEHVAGSDRLTLDFPRPNDDEAARWEVEHLTALQPRDLVRPDERLREAGDALDILAELSTLPKLYDIRRIQGIIINALNTPALASKAVSVLAKINSPEAQQALIQTASADGLPMELRQAAVEAFRVSVQAHGILLKTNEILRQYDLYNRSKNADEGTRKVLSLLLDCLEAPTAKKSK